jgi:hypothetical protein
VDFVNIQNGVRIIYKEDLLQRFPEACNLFVVFLLDSISSDL